LAENPTDLLRERLPQAQIVVLEEGDDVAKVLMQGDCPVIGAAGGDGTLAAAAAVAVDHDALFVPVPAGTLNHFSRDLGLASAEDAVDAVRAGFEAAVDVGVVGDRIFINTLSFGGYSAVVDTRERWQPRLGKWPALVVALITELPRMTPLRITLDGEPMRVWLGWIGNGAYSPAGLAPAWREDLADGLLDVRLVHGGRKFARTRFTLAAFCGRLTKCAVYSQRRVESVAIECLEGPPRLAADGETFDGPASFTVSKKRGGVRVALPPPA
jgi:undecaprenyl-diphosphatase